MDRQPLPLALQHGRSDPDEARWAAFARRDSAADGLFVACVRTTRIYCRPSCPARRARRDHVVFADTSAEAERLGYRACKRCRPDEASQGERHAALVARACRAIEQAEHAPSLAVLAGSLDVSAHHLHRIFKAATGVTLGAYARQHRAARVVGALRESKSVTAAVYEAGFNAPSRFYAAAEAHLGMTPTTYRNGGAGVAIRFSVAACQLGSVLVAATAKGICAILIGDDRAALERDLRDRFSRAEITADAPAFDDTVAAVVAFLDSPRGRLDLPLDISGTAFQQRVWQALRAVPAGTTVSYAELAAAIGEPRAVRAVASACRANPVAVAIPCHRVLRSDGGMSGYRWGVERKRTLIAREAADDGSREDAPSRKASPL